MAVVTADLYDELGDAVQSLSLPLVSFGASASFDGPIRTVRCFEDNALLKSVLSADGAGQVLVVDGGGSLERALVGDVIAQLAIDNGWVGIVINGVVRDRVALGAMAMGVKALGSNPSKGTRTGEGELDISVSFGGVDFRPGAHLYSDEDGILVER